MWFLQGWDDIRLEVPLTKTPFLPPSSSLISKKPHLTTGRPWPSEVWDYSEKHSSLFFIHLAGQVPRMGTWPSSPEGNWVDYFLKEESLACRRSHHLLPNSRFLFQRRHEGVQGKYSHFLWVPSLFVYLQLKPAMVQVCCSSNKILPLLSQDQGLVPFSVASY